MTPSWPFGAVEERTQGYGNRALGWGVRNKRNKSLPPSKSPSSRARLPCLDLGFRSVPCHIFETVTISAATFAAGLRTPVVMLHASLSCKSQWDPLSQKLATRFEPVPLDLIGYGTHIAPASGALVHHRRRGAPRRAADEGRRRIATYSPRRSLVRCAGRVAPGAATTRTRRGRTLYSRSPCGSSGKTIRPTRAYARWASSCSNTSTSVATGGAASSTTGRWRLCDAARDDAQRCKRVAR